MDSACVLRSRHVAGVRAGAARWQTCYFLDSNGCSVGILCFFSVLGGQPREPHRADTVARMRGPFTYRLSCPHPCCSSFSIPPILSAAACMPSPAAQPVRHRLRLPRPSSRTPPPPFGLPQPSTHWSVEGGEQERGRDLDDDTALLQINWSSE